MVGEGLEELLEPDDAPDKPKSDILQAEIVTASVASARNRPVLFNVCTLMPPSELNPNFYNNRLYSNS
jgi:hypothetical protein